MSTSAYTMVQKISQEVYAITASDVEGFSKTSSVLHSAANSH